MKRELLIASILLFVGFMAFAQTKDCNELYFSSYLEGSSNNKALQIYNPTRNTVNLVDYKVLVYFNGSVSASSTLSCKGKLAPGRVYVVANSSSTSNILAIADTTSSVATFNGDDAILLFNSKTGDSLDVIGLIGTDPGTNWKVGSGATSEYTLIRKPNVKKGNMRWKTSANEWTIHPQNYADSLDNHLSNCNTNPLANFKFVSTKSQISESNFTGFVKVIGQNLTAAQGYNLRVRIDSTTGTATWGTDYSASSVVLTISDKNPMDSVSYTILDDKDFEATESFTFTLDKPSDGKILQDSVFTVEILDNDSKIYSIKELRTNDADGISIHEGEEVSSYGMVNSSVNLNVDGVWFAMEDDNFGITILDMANNYGYQPSEGDSIRVEGTVHTYNGNTVIDILKSIEYVNSNSPAKATTVQQIEEVHESRLMEIENVRLVDASQWTSTGDFFIVQVYNATDTFQLMINQQVKDVYTSLAPGFTYMNIVGVVYQDDKSAPYESNYFLSPRGLADFSNVYPVFSMADAIDADVDGIPLNNQKKMTVRAVVNNEVNFNPAGFLSTIQTGNAGIAIASASPISYQAALGDSIQVSGTLKSIDGRIVLDEIMETIVLSKVDTIKPRLVNSLSEKEENNLVQLKGLSLLKSTDWNKNATSAYFVDFTDGKQTITLKINEGTDLLSQAVPTGKFNVIGIGSQYDKTIPYADSYVLEPRSWADFEVVIPTTTDELNNAEVHFYPNPAREYLNVSSSYPIVQVRVLSLVGQEMVNTQVGELYQYNLSLKGLQEGVYIIECYTSVGSKLTERLIVK